MFELYALKLPDFMSLIGLPVADGPLVVDELLVADGLPHGCEENEVDRMHDYEI
jgi:hypothetical protein